MPPVHRRRESSIPSVVDGLVPGSIRLEIEDIAEKITANAFALYSPVVEVMGTPWKLLAKKIATSEYLGVFVVHRRSDSGIWSINITGTIGLIHQDGGEVIYRKMQTTCNHNALAWGFENLVLWSDAIDEEKGFLKDNKLVIETRFVLSNFAGMRLNRRVNFANKNDVHHDVTLVVGGKKIYASKRILAIHSPFFNAMFYGDFRERNMRVIRLNDIDRKTFVTMLHLIYPSYEKITEDNAEPLLKLADQYQIKTVFDQVEQFLIGSDKLTTLEKLKISDEYKLVLLQDHCLAKFKTVKQITDLQETDVYKELSDNAKVSLLDKVMKLSNGNY